MLLSTWYFLFGFAAFAASQRWRVRYKPIALRPGLRSIRPQFVIRTFAPTKAATTSTSTTTTTTTTTTARPTTTTTTKTTRQTITLPQLPPRVCNVCVFFCGNADELITVMRDEGIYNPMYMAVDFDSAAQQFPDLSSEQYLQAEPYTCDAAECAAKVHRIRQIWRSHGKEVGADPIPLVQSTPPPQVVFNWEFWKPRPLFTLPKEQKNPRRSHMTRKPPNPHSSNGFESWRDTDWLSVLERSSTHQRGRKRKKRESLGGEQSNSPLDIIGSSYAVYCTEAGTEVEQKQHSLCGSCRAVRQLPEEYFPRLLNELICKDSHCISGHGKCIQKFMPFKVLKNYGSSHCPHWRPVYVTVRTCCDCLISSDSKIYTAFVAKRQ